MAAYTQACAIREAMMGEMKRAEARYREEFYKKMDEQHRMKSTLAICASIIAAVRLAREPDITRPTPRLAETITDCVGLARMILEKIVR